MLLDQALQILARVHTEEDDVTGFFVRLEAIHFPIFSQTDYVQAWKTVREHLHLPVAPFTPP